MPMTAISTAASAPPVVLNRSVRFFANSSCPVD
jgi:hypothetical protein